MQKVPMLRQRKSHETMHINFLPLEKMHQVSQKELFFTICTSLVSNGGDKITREIFNKELCQRNLPGLSIKLTTPNQMMSYIYPIYSGADSDHTKHLVDPQLREGESCEWPAKLCKQIVAQRPTD